MQASCTTNVDLTLLKPSESRFNVIRDSSKKNKGSLMWLSPGPPTTQPKPTSALIYSTHPSTHPSIHPSIHPHAHAHTHTRTHRHTNTDAHTQSLTHSDTHTHTNTHRPANTHTYARTHRHTQSHTHAHKHTYTHRHTHAHTHTHTHAHRHLGQALEAERAGAETGRQECLRGAGLRVCDLASQRLLRGATMSVGMGETISAKKIVLLLLTVM